MHTRIDLAGVEVNLSTLDTLVKDYAKLRTEQEGSSGAAYRACQSLRLELAEGNIDQAVSILQQHFPTALQDQRLVFKLRKQQFVEVMRKAQPNCLAEAIACARKELAPLALDAYPEAYVEFKKLLLLLVYPDGKQHKDIASLWSAAARHDLADVVYFTVLQTLDLPDSPLSLLLRYLLHLRDAVLGPAVNSSIISSSSGGGGSTAQSPKPGQEPELAASLLLPGRDPQPLPLEHYQGPTVSEASVQALIQCTGTSRQAATNALKHAGGNQQVAFMRELLRIRLNHDVLEDLIQEYIVYRGLANVSLPGKQPHTTGSEATATTSGRKPGDNAVAGVSQHMTQPTSACQAAGPERDGPAAAGRDASGSGSSPRPHKIWSSPPLSPTGGGTRPSGKVELTLPPPPPLQRMGSALSSESMEVDDDTNGAAGPSGQGGPPDGIRDGVNGDPDERGAGGPSGAAASAAAGASAAATPSASVRQNLPVGPSGGRTSSASPPMKVPRWRDGDADGGTAEVQGGLNSSHGGGPSSGNGGSGGVGDGGDGDGGGTSSSGRGGGGSSPREPGKVGGGSSSGAGSGQSQRTSEQALLQLQQLAKDGDVPGVIALVEALDPGFFAAHPALLFDMRRCGFGARLAAGDITGALAAARNELTPLAEAHPALLPLLKATMTALLPAPLPPPAPARTAAASGTGAAGAGGGGGGGGGEGGVAGLPTLPALVGTLQAALQARLGVQGPRLVNLLQLLLAVHKAWLKMEKYVDPFASLLKIDTLRTTPAPAPGTAPGSATATLAAAAGSGGGGGTSAGAAGASPGMPGLYLPMGLGVGSGGDAQLVVGPLEPAEDAEVYEQDEEMYEDGMEDDGSLVDVDEDAVMRLIEIMALPRGAAIDLLQSHDNNVEAAIMSLLS